MTKIPFIIRALRGLLGFMLLIAAVAIYLVAGFGGAIISAWSALRGFTRRGFQTRA